MSHKAASHLTYEERCQIYALLKSGNSRRKVAKLLGRSHSTVVRELQRNEGQRGYRFKQAQSLSEERRKIASSKPKKMTPSTINLIKEMMGKTQASPRQISGRLSQEYDLSISHESIYKLVWGDKKLGGELHKHLRHGTKKYNKRSGKTSGRGLIPNRVDIDQRPAIVEKKERFGDFELDTIVGANHQGAIVSIVDRASKHTYLELLP